VHGRGISIAPTRTTPWIALAPDISGVCRVAGHLADHLEADQQASTKTVRSASSSGLMSGLLGVLVEPASRRRVHDLAVVGDDDRGLDLVGRGR
jgi:hypothetical protein